MRGLTAGLVDGAPEARSRAAFERHLDPRSARPLAVALSGGGDSTALLLLAAAWARAQGRGLVALTVDHRLQPESEAWSARCAALAARLGVGFQGLAWEAAKPARGLPAAARAARHRLLAEAARGLGARVLLMGHTADDVLEARAMRAAGATTPDPRPWSPSPAWPEGRGLFLLRPLLTVRRAALRRWLAQAGEAWIEDPANADPRFARARARAGLVVLGDGVEPAPELPLGLAAVCEVDPLGGVSLDRRLLRAAPSPEASRWLGLACVCAGGGSRLPASGARERLAERLRGGDAVTATLAGARIEADAELVRIVRESGEAARGGLQAAALSPGVPQVWDGRFELSCAGEGLRARRLGGVAWRLPPAQRRALQVLPPAVRGGLPAIVDAEGAVTCPLLGGSPAAARSLVGERFMAAAGQVLREPD